MEIGHRNKTPVNQLRLNPLTGGWVTVATNRALRPEELGFGLGEGVAHLNFLESEGVLASRLHADGRRRFVLA